MIEKKGEKAIREEDWLSGICDYTGPGANLPTGGFTTIEGLFPEDLVAEWKVMELPTGKLAVKPTDQLTKKDIILGCTMSPEVLQAILDTYGPNWAVVTDANNHHLSLDQWQAKYHTNGLGLWAIRNERRKIKGSGGITIYK